ncbi:MAG: guanitoxin biosynthesis MATE family efflux transporter GntT [Xenococcaceae cyanobacterium]
MEKLQQRFWRLALVNVVSNLTVPLASLIDTAFLGHLADIHHLGGVAIATVLFNYIYWSFGFLRMGTTGTTAQATGKGDRDEVILILLRNSSIAIAIGTIILILQLPLRELGFTLLSATPEVLESGRAYYNALIWGAPATLLNFVLLGWFLGREQGSKVLLMSVIDKTANVSLNYLFIIRFGWASSGAGWATAISLYLNLLVGLILIIQQLPVASVQNLSHKIFDRSAWHKIFNLNRDITIRTLALLSTFALFTNLSAIIGTTVLATNTLLMQVVTLGAYFIDGIAFATESLAGILRGQKNNHQLLSLIKLAGGISLSVGLAMSVVFWLIPQPLFRLLTNHAEVIEQIDNYVFWLLPVLGFGSIAYMLDGYFLGLSEGKILRQSTIIAASLGFLPMAIAAWQYQSSHLLWLGLSLFMLGRSLTLGFKVPQTYRSKSV